MDRAEIQDRSLRLLTAHFRWWPLWRIIRELDARGPTATPTREEERQYQLVRQYWVTEFDRFSRDVYQAFIGDRRIGLALEAMRQCHAWPDLAVACKNASQLFYEQPYTPSQWISRLEIAVEDLWLRYWDYLEEAERSLPSSWTRVRIRLASVRRVPFAIIKSLEWIDRHRWISGVLLAFGVVLVLSLIPVPDRVIDVLLRLTPMPPR